MCPWFSAPKKKTDSPEFSLSTRSLTVAEKTDNQCKRFNYVDKNSTRCHSRLDPNCLFIGESSTGIYFCDRNTKHNFSIGEHDEGMNFSKFDWFINYEYHKTVPVSASDYVDGQVFFSSYFAWASSSTLRHLTTESLTLCSRFCRCVLVGLKADRCEYKLVEKKIFLSMKEKGNEKSFASSQKEWREAQALKIYSIISIAHHRTDWKPLKSAHFASLYDNLA